MTNTPPDLFTPRLRLRPFTLDDAAASTTHLVALRIPHGTRVDRLGALSWVENDSGAVVTIAQAGAEDCPQRK